MQTLLTTSLAFVSVLYPAAVYFGVGHVSPSVFAFVFIAAGLARFCLSHGVNDRGQWIVLGLAVVYGGVLLSSGSGHLLKLYPAGISICIGAAFLASLYQKESLIERVARLSGKTITSRAKRYTGKLSFIWGLLLLCNAAVAGYLAYFGSLDAWALYTGLLSYLIFAAFFAAEFVYRQFYMAKYRGESESGNK